MNIYTIKMSLWYSNVNCTFGGMQQKYMLLASVGNLCSFFINSAGHNTALLHGSNKLSVRVGQFCSFLNFMKSHGFAVP